MASGRTRVRHSVVVGFDTQEEKAAFQRRLEHVRALLTPAGQPTLDNNGLMAAIFDHVELLMPTRSPFPGSERASVSVQSFNRNSGKRCS